MTPSRLLRFLQWTLLLEMVVLGIAARATGDDGPYIMGGYLAAHGLTPFIDFPYAQGPLLPYLQAPVIRAMGPTLLASRVFGLVFLMALYWVCLKIVDAVWRESWPGEDGLDTLKAALTCLFILYPELLGALSRVGTKESVASLFCVAAVGSPMLFRRTRWPGVVLAGALTAISVGIKYTAAIVLVPIIAFLLLSGPVTEVALYLFSVAAGAALVFGPYVLSGHSDMLLANFLSTVTQVQKVTPTLASRLLNVALVTIPSLLRVAAKFQLVLLPSIAWFWFEISRYGYRAFLKRPHNILLAGFFFMTVGMYFIVSPVIQRAYMFVPLLLIHGAISVVRLWKERPRPTTALVVTLVVTILAVNTAFLFAWQYNDAGFTFPSFDTLRYRPTAEMRAFCAEHSDKDILYIGSFQHLWLEAGCRLSVYSAVSNFVLPIGQRFPTDQARRYKFITDQVMMQMLATREFEDIVFDRGMLDQGTDSYGVDYAAIQTAVRSKYDRRDLWLWEVYTAR